jgi:hypothetical protein
MEEVTRKTWILLGNYRSVLHVLSNQTKAKYGIAVNGSSTVFNRNLVQKSKRVILLGKKTLEKISKTSKTVTCIVMGFAWNIRLGTEVCKNFKFVNQI